MYAHKMLFLARIFVSSLYDCLRNISPPHPMQNNTMSHTYKSPVYCHLITKDTHSMSVLSAKIECKKDICS